MSANGSSSSIWVKGAFKGWQSRDSFSIRLHKSVDTIIVPLYRQTPGNPGSAHEWVIGLLFHSELDFWKNDGSICWDDFVIRADI